MGSFLDNLDTITTIGKIGAAVLTFAVSIVPLVAELLG